MVLIFCFFSLPEMFFSHRNEREGDLFRYACQIVINAIRVAAHLLEMQSAMHKHKMSSKKFSFSSQIIRFSCLQNIFKRFLNQFGSIVIQFVMLSVAFKADYCKRKGVDSLSIDILISSNLLSGFDRHTIFHGILIST